MFTPVVLSAAPEQAQTPTQPIQHRWLPPLGMAAISLWGATALAENSLRANRVPVSGLARRVTLDLARLYPIMTPLSASISLVAALANGYAVRATGFVVTVLGTSLVAPQARRGIEHWISTGKALPQSNARKIIGQLIMMCVGTAAITKAAQSQPDTFLETPRNLSVKELKQVLRHNLQTELGAFGRSMTQLPQQFVALQQQLKKGWRALYNSDGPLASMLYCVKASSFILGSTAALLAYGFKLKPLETLSRYSQELGKLTEFSAELLSNFHQWPRWISTLYRSSGLFHLGFLVSSRTKKAILGFDAMDLAQLATVIQSGSYFLSLLGKPLAPIGLPKPGPSYYLSQSNSVASSITVIPRASALSNLLPAESPASR